MVDELVDGRVLDADEVAAAFPACRFRAPEIALLVAGGIGLGEVADHDVVIEDVQAPRILGGVHHADGALDAELLEVAQIGLHDALEQRRDEQELRGERPPRLGVGEHAALHLIARVLQDQRRLAQIGAHVLGLGVHRVLVDLGEYLRGHLTLDLVQDLKLPALRQRLRRREVRILEIAADPGILAIEQVLVRPFEIEGEVEGLAHAAVDELRTPQVEHEALHGLRAFEVDLLAFDSAVAHRREVVSRGPVLGARLLVIVEIAGLEALKRDGLVAVIVEADLVVIPLALADGEVLAPIVGHPLIRDGAAWRHLLDAVGAGAKRRLERGLHGIARVAGRVLPRPVMLGQDGELAHDHGQLTIALHVEAEGDLVGSGGFRLGDILVIERHARIGGLVDLEAIDDVLGRDGRAVMPARSLAELEGDRGKVGRVRGPFGDQAIGGRGLLQAVGHEGLIDEPEPGGRLALVKDGIEAVERADIGHAHDPALRRIGVHIVEMGEVGRVFGHPDQRHRVVVLTLLAHGGKAHKACEAYGKGDAAKDHGGGCCFGAPWRVAASEFKASSLAGGLGLKARWAWRPGKTERLNMGPRRTK